MNIIEVNLVKPIYWLIHKNDPVTYELRSKPELSFINPLMFPLRAKDRLTSQSYTSRVIVRDSVLIHTSELLFLSPERIGSEKNGVVEDKKILDFFNYIQNFVVSLRYTSKQADISGEIEVLQQIPVESQVLEEATINFPTASSSEGFYKKYLVDTAVTWKALEQADCVLADSSIPVFGTLLLDAIHAFNERDFRRVILYSAMTLEALASTKLDKMYTSFLDSDNPPDRLHIVSFPQPHGVTSKKDPIYTALSEGDKFSRLLHELPLYLLNRSLLVENEALYLNALKLYRTRNKIVHTGNVPTESEGKYFKASDNDVNTILLCVKDILTWFGVTDDYILPTFGFVQVESIEGQKFFG